MTAQTPSQPLSNGAQAHLNKWMEMFTCRLVALCGAYLTLDDNGKPKDHKFFCYTGFVVEIDGRWYMVTAGHCLEEFDQALSHPKIEITGVALAGWFGPSMTNVIVVPFHHFRDAKRQYVHDLAQGLDYGWMEIRPIYRDVLETQGALPLPLFDPALPPPGIVAGHVIVGFPDELVEKDLNTVDQVGTLVGIIEPVLISANEMQSPPADIAPLKSKWFVGELMKPPSIKSAVGLSGGPIIEISAKGNEFFFRMIALQSWWKDQRRIVFGCPAKVFLPRVLSEVAAYHQTGKAP